MVEQCPKALLDENPSPCKLPKDDPLSGQAVIATLTLSLAAVAASLRVFGGERTVFWRESSTGMSTLVRDSARTARSLQRNVCSLGVGVLPGQELGAHVQSAGGRLLLPSGVLSTDDAVCAALGDVQHLLRHVRTFQRFACAHVLVALCAATGLHPRLVVSVFASSIRPDLCVLADLVSILSGPKQAQLFGVLAVLISMVCGTGASVSVAAQCLARADVFWHESSLRAAAHDSRRGSHVPNLRLLHRVNEIFSAYTVLSSRWSQLRARAVLSRGDSVLPRDL